MITIDTNVLVRYVFDEEDALRPASLRLIDDVCRPDAPGFVTDVALAELAWVALRTMRAERSALVELLRSLLDHPNLAFEDRESLEAVVDAFSRGRADFADYLIAAIGRAHGAETTVTFDRDASREPGFTRLT